jgi:Family of unknown function (DUF6228)
VEQVIFDGQQGRTLTLRLTGQGDSGEGWTYDATLAFPEGRATVAVYDDGRGLAPFFRELADAWRGFSGEKTYESLEGQLYFACTHDGIGTVECRVVLRQPGPSDWRVEAVLEFGAGAHLERIASDVEAFVEASA